MSSNANQNQNRWQYHLTDIEQGFNETAVDQGDEEGRHIVLRQVRSQMVRPRWQINLLPLLLYLSPKYAKQTYQIAQKIMNTNEEMEEAKEYEASLEASSMA